MAATATRPVRVTIVGEARPLLTDGTLMRLQSLAGVLLIDTAALDVAVEYLDPSREWTDGDVVLIGGTVWVRQGETSWASSGGYGTQLGYDSDIEQALDDGRAQVLRYQAGGDA